MPVDKQARSLAQLAHAEQVQSGKGGPVRADRRVRVFVWYLLQDHPDWASGVLDVAGNRKPSYRVFRSQAVRTR